LQRDQQHLHNQRTLLSFLVPVAHDFDSFVLKQLNQQDTLLDEDFDFVLLFSNEPKVRIEKQTKQR
jgi:hypothetical protein